MSKVFDHYVDFITGCPRARCANCGEWFLAKAGYKLGERLANQLEGEHQLDFCGGSCLIDWKNALDEKNEVEFE